MEKPFNLQVGAALREARHARVWTQARLADNAGLSPNFIARVERGEMGVSLFVANRMCRALGIELRALVGRGGETRSGVVRRAARRRGA